MTAAFLASSVLEHWHMFPLLIYVTQCLARNPSKFLSKEFSQNYRNTLLYARLLGLVAASEQGSHWFGQCPNTLSTAVLEGCEKRLTSRVEPACPCHQEGLIHSHGGTGTEDRN